MTDLNIDGTVFAPGVVETIISLAARDVDGVAGVGSAAAEGLRTIIGGGKPSTQGVEIAMDENDKLNVEIHLDAKSGLILPDLADEVRQAIADALHMQVGIEVAAVDVFIDGIQFAN